MNELDFNEQDWGMEQPMTRRDCSRMEPFTRPADRPPRIRRVIRVRPDGAYVERGEQQQPEPQREEVPSYEPVWSYGGQQGPLSLTCHCGGPAGGAPGSPPIAPPVCPPGERPPEPPALPPMLPGPGLPGPMGPTGPTGPTGPMGPAGPAAVNAFLFAVDPVVGGQQLEAGQNLRFALATQGGLGIQQASQQEVQLAPGAYLALLRASVDAAPGQAQVVLQIDGEPVPGGRAEAAAPAFSLSAILNTQGGRLSVQNQGGAAAYRDLSLTLVRLDG